MKKAQPRLGRDGALSLWETKSPFTNTSRSTPRNLSAVKRLTKGLPRNLRRHGHRQGFLFLKSLSLTAGGFVFVPSESAAREAIALGASGPERGQASDLGLATRLPQASSRKRRGFVFVPCESAAQSSLPFKGRAGVGMGLRYTCGPNVPYAMRSL